MNWQLQVSEALAVGWTDVPVAPVITDGCQSVSLAKGDRQQFFRLRKATAGVASAPAAAASDKATEGTPSTTETRPPTKRIFGELSW